MIVFNVKKINFYKGKKRHSQEKNAAWNFRFLCGITELEKFDSDNGASPKDLGR